ncbi:stress responsive protein [Sporanaerobium hydrogeniformans]|uniref:Stress responsive protein n=1 Tax=Sporanaerobium hydrogeniformans TaxID=3072179 RepID=A0AC61DDK0_9FIRM|nr:Dabb family protein [Sporanaerobium hydrogeniformans]PHV71235.1 stress responsive protein [Sporanaerobium hydrogeniformans]
MVKHIVMWKVKEHEVHGTKQEVMIKMKNALEGLKGQIKGLQEIEVGINFNTGDAAYDVVLYSVFDNKEALEYYQAHPKHLEVANELVRQVTISRVVTDYCVE